MNKIVAGIVLYNPNIARYQNCVYKLLEQVEKIYIFDNSDKPINYIESEKIVYISEKRNCGIAYALNRIMEHAKDDGYNWLITMDQDSIIPDGMVVSKNDQPLELFVHR